MGRRGLLLLLVFFSGAWWSHGFWPSTQYMALDRYLERVNKPPVKTIKSEDGDIIDCVDIYKQPAFDHPLLSNHTIQMEPSSYLNGVRPEEDSSFEFQQLWHRVGRCPDRTIPIRRIRKSDILRASSLRSYGKKFQRRFVGLNFTGLASSPGHEHAIAYVNSGKYYGAKASINTWNPKLQASDEFSLAQIWVVSNAGGNLETTEAGWMVSPTLFGDDRTRLFIYWTADNYQNTGCYNLFCPGFVQTNKDIALGTIVTPISTYGGKQFFLFIYINKDPSSGNWWLQVHDKVLGYWPGSLFKSLADAANLVEWGGEVLNTEEDGRHTSTQMGSGHFPPEDFGKSSYFSNLKIVDATHTLRDPNSITPLAEAPRCYDVKIGANKKTNYGYYFYYGGPGQSPTCP